jgi:hypothetical protein
MQSVLMLGDRQSIQCSAGEGLGQTTCIRWSVLSGARALSAAACSPMVSAHASPTQERWGGGVAQVIGQAFMIWGMHKELNPNSHPFPMLQLRISRPVGGARSSQPIGRLLTVLSAHRASPSIGCSVLNALAREGCTQCSVPKKTAGIVKIRTMRHCVVCGVALCHWSRRHFLPAHDVALASLTQCTSGRVLNSPGTASAVLFMGAT